MYIIRNQRNKIRITVTSDRRLREFTELTLLSSEVERVGEGTPGDSGGVMWFSTRCEAEILHSSNNISNIVILTVLEMLTKLRCSLIME